MDDAFFNGDDFRSLMGEASHHLPSMAMAMANKKLLEKDSTGCEHEPDYTGTDCCYYCGRQIRALKWVVV